MIDTFADTYRISVRCILLVGILLFYTAVYARGASTDEVDNTKYLEEIVVEAKRGWVEDGKIVFIPTKKEKQLSNSAASLIQSMSLPILRTEDGSIKTINGNDVKIFINGRLASDVELATFWPKHAQRVEYMVNSQDGNYAGYRNVVNFVMIDYEIGGITKIDAQQEFPLSGAYSVASKFVYKSKFSLGAIVNTEFSDYNINISSGWEIFRNVYYNQQFYDEIKSEEKVNNATKNHGISGAIVQRYVSKMFGCMHQFKLRWSKSPGILSEGNKAWMPSLFGDDYYGYYSKSSSFVPGVSGMYRWTISPRWILNGEWEYLYNQNKSEAWSKTGDMTPIDNNTVESVNSFNFRISPSFYMSPKFMFNYVLVGDFTSYKTNYSGSATASCLQSRQNVDNSFNVYWNITNSLYVVANPRLNISLWQIEQVNEKQINPSVSVGAEWSANSRLNIMGEIQYNCYSANPNELNPVLVQSSELMWLKGNPYLMNNDAWFTVLSVNYLPLNRLSFSFHNNYSRSNGGILFEYTPMDKDYGGVLKTAYNTSSSDHFSSSLGIHTSFFERTLTLHLQGIYNFAKEYLTKIDLHTFNWRVDASYTLGNVRLSLNYRSPVKALSNGGRETIREASRFDVSLTYGWNNLYMDFTLIDLFHKYSKQSVVYESQNYSFSTKNYNVGRAFSINLTYTFGYGKEINPNINASIPEAKTNVLH